MWQSRCLQVATNTAMVAAVGALLLAGFRHLLPYPHQLWALIAMGFGLMWLLWKAFDEYRALQDPIIAARQIDRRAGLHNRITTAVEQSKSDSNSIGQLLHQDAMDSIDGLRPETVVSLPSAASPISALLALIASLFLLFLSPLIAPTVVASQTIQGVHAPASLDRLTDILQGILAELKSGAEQNPSAELEALIHETEETLKEIQEGKLTTAEAFVQLSKLQQQMLAGSQSEDIQKLDPAWEKVADALSSSQATAAIADRLQSKQFDQAAKKMAELPSDAFDSRQLTPAEVTSLTEKLDDAASLTDDEDLANVLKDLSLAIADGRSETASQKMQDLAAESTKYQMELDQAQHLDDFSDQLEIGKQQLAISSNSSGDGQMGGQGLNEETGKSKGKGGADSQKAGAKTAGNIDGPKADLERQRQLAELQGQFGEEGKVEVKTKSTDQRPEFEVTRKAQAVHAEYSRQLEADLKQQQVPAGHQGIVRKYFESIRPATDKSK